jgi:hypothetical protein
MSDPVWRRIGALQRVLAPEEPPDFSGMTAEECLLWHLNKYGLAEMLSPSFESEDRDLIEAGAEDAAAASEVSVEVTFGAPPAPDSAAAVDPPPQVEATPPPPREPPASVPWWEAQLQYRPRRGPYAEDVPEEPAREPWEEDDDFTS